MKLTIEDMHGLKVNPKVLNGERLIDLKHKPLKDKEVTEIAGHQELSIK